MRHARIALFLAGALAVGPTPAFEVQGNAIVFTEAEMRACVEEGGCRLITRAWFEHHVQLAVTAACKGSI